MWFFDSIADRMRLISSAFKTAADNLANIPAVGQYLEDPIRELESLFSTVAYFFDSAATWADDVRLVQDKVLSWFSIKIRLLADYPWIADPVGDLWYLIWVRIRDYTDILDRPEEEPAESIWSRLTSAVSWLASPVTSLAGGIWDVFTSADPWLKNPVNFLASGIWDAFTFANPWLKDWKFSVTDLIIGGFGGWFWTFLEWNASIAIGVAGRILENMWDREEEE